MGSLEVAGIGQNIVAGIGDAMAAAGWSGYATTVSGNWQAAVNAALGINSPATTHDDSHGHVGRRGHRAGHDELWVWRCRGNVSSNSKSGVGNLTSAGKTVGKNFSQGIAQGITSGTMFIRAAATKVAKAAKEAAEKALEEKSPSRVGKRIGAFYTKGIALGIDDPKQIAAVRNASRFIGTDVTRTSYNSVSTDNRRTYNQDQSVTVNVEGLSVKDQMDVRALAVEISRLSRRTKYGHGGRDS